MSTPDGNGSAALEARVDALESLLRTASAVDEKTLKELRRTMDALAKRDPKFEERVSNRVDVIADRLETVTKTVSTSSTTLVAKQGEIVQLRRDLDAALARVDRTAAELRQGPNDAELVEIRQALAELSTLTKQKLPRGLESRVVELADKFAMLAQRVDSVSTTVSTTAAGLAGRDGDIIALRRAVEAERDRVTQELTALQRAVDPRPVAELRDALKAQADEAARQHYATRQLVAKAGASVDALDGQVASVGATLSSTADRVTETQAALTSLRTHYAESGEKLNAYLTEQRRALEALSARAASLEQAGEEAARSLGERVNGIAGTVDGLTRRIDSVSGVLESSTNRIAHNEESVSSLRDYVDEAGRRLNVLLADQAGSLAALGERAAALEETTDGVTLQRLEQRISGADRRVEELAEEISSVTAALASTSERVDARDTDLQALEHRFREASSRVESLVGDLSRSLADIPDPAAAAEALDRRLGKQEDILMSFADRLSRTETAIADELRAVTSASAETERLASETRETTVAVSDRLDGLTALVDSFSGTLASSADRIAQSEERVSSMRDYVDEAGTRLNAMLADHARSLAALGERAAKLEETSGETVQRLDKRVAAASTRVDELATTVDAAASSLRQREHELALRDRQFTDAGTRIESVVDDIREALSAFPELGAVSIEEIAGRLERVAERVERSEAATRENTEAGDRLTAALSQRLEAMEAQVATVAGDVARAKTLWPVALRSLEARLDDVARHIAPAEAPLEGDTDRRADDELLVGLRDSLQTMETVAAEMARASDVLAPSDEGAERHEAIAAGGATIVPLRSSDP